MLIFGIYVCTFYTCTLLFLVKKQLQSQKHLALNWYFFCGTDHLLITNATEV